MDGMGNVFLFINSPPELFQIWPHQGPTVVGGVATEAAKVGRWFIGTNKPKDHRGGTWMSQEASKWLVNGL